MFGKEKKKQPDGSIGVVYARYSSHNQKDASIEQQVEACYARAKELGLTLIDTYEDRAISGRTDKRPSFQRMMRDAESGAFDFVLAWKSNRIGRNMMEAMVNEARLQELGVRVLYVEEDFDDSAAGRFALRSMMNVNQFYSENMSEDIRRGMMDNARNCKVTNGMLPFGFKKTADLHLEIDEERAKIVQEIFARVAEGESFLSIARDLNSRGIKTARGREWNRGSFHVMLTNERYTGVYIYGDIRVEGGIPRIVNDELFWRVQDVLKIKKNPQGRGRHRVTGSYLLTGKLFCGHCKSPMIGISGTSRTGALHYYYICQKKRNEHSCSKKTLTRDAVEEGVARAIKTYILQPDSIEKITNQAVEYAKKSQEASEVSLLENELANVQAAIQNIMKAIEMGVLTESTKLRLLELEAKKAELERKIVVARSKVLSIHREDVIAWLSILSDGNVLDKKYQALLFDTFLIAVYLYDDKIKVIFTYSDKKKAIDIPTGDIAVAEQRSCVSDTASDIVRIESLSLRHQTSEIYMGFRGFLHFTHISQTFTFQLAFCAVLCYNGQYYGLLCHNI